MRRVLLEWRGIRIYSYPALLYAGLISGTVAGTRAAALAGLDQRRAYIAILILLAPALAGARLLFTVAHWDVYRREPARIFRLSEGGQALYGGLLLAFAVSVPLLGALRLDFWTFWDAAAIAMLVGMVFAKVGCLLNGCCSGRSTAGILGMTTPNHLGVVERRIPAQLLEAALALGILAAAAAAWPRRPYAGSVFLATVAAYAAARALLEGTREDVDRVRGWNLHRLISIALAALSATALLILALR